MPNSFTDPTSVTQPGARQPKRITTCYHMSTGGKPPLTLEQRNRNAQLAEEKKKKAERERRAAVMKERKLDAQSLPAIRPFFGAVSLLQPDNLIGSNQKVAARPRAERLLPHQTRNLSFFSTTIMVRAAVSTRILRASPMSRVLYPSPIGRTPAIHRYKNDKHVAGVLYVNGRVDDQTRDDYNNGIISLEELLDRIDVKVGHTKAIRRRMGEYRRCANGQTIVWSALDEPLTQVFCIQNVGCTWLYERMGEYYPLREIGSFDALDQIIRVELRAMGLGNVKGKSMASRLHKMGLTLHKIGNMIGVVAADTMTAVYVPAPATVPVVARTRLSVVFKRNNYKTRGRVALHVHPLMGGLIVSSTIFTATPPTTTTEPNGQTPIELTWRRSLGLTFTSAWDLV
ncbi:hypothetical protein C8R43DRAFT_1133718 [Mycena crocata]|nr:hypothetical protein C8R43DRAFT_1133718 [Mycena crocata]